MADNPVKLNQQAKAQLQLQDLIARQGLWGRRLMGERELAALLHVGRGTLRRALAELESRNIVDRRHGSGTFACERASRTGRSRMARIAVIADSHFEHATGWNHHGEMIRGVRLLAPRLRADCTVLAMDRPAERAIVDDPAAMRQFAGFVAVSMSERDLLMGLVELARGPVVLVNHFVRDLPLIEVVDGSFEGARAVARHLIALGHRRIAFLDCYDRDATNPEKYAGYRAALLERGIPFDEQLVACPSKRDDPAGFSRKAIDRLLSLSRPPTAFFAYDDFHALPALTALEGRGLKVGRDVSLAGFGDSAIRRGACDWLTSCRIYWRRMGQEAIRAVLGRHRRGEGRTIIVPNRLFIRRSTAAPNH